MRRALLVACLAACAADDAPAPDFPRDYTATFAEVRDCRRSGDHDLHFIRILADPVGLAAYRDRTAFPAGAIVVKEEYDFTDGACAGAILQWTSMVKLAEPGDDTVRTWHWQRVDAARTVVEEDTPRCLGCHAQCGGPPDGHDGTCATP
ncbi:MAG: cytochrome P460 family protein [Deltaproteobacteria bacterium]|nr:cytochrome P460 family protein [Deltaproteobacteria bacterium]